MYLDRKAFIKTRRIEAERLERQQGGGE